MEAKRPQAVLFCCDHNSVRSPMAEGMMKAFYGHEIYVQSAGIHSETDIDGFSIAVCKELGIELSSHQVRSFDQMEDWGDDLSSFDLVLALSPASQHRVLDLIKASHVEVEYWPILDPTGIGTRREEKLAAYRQTRDQIRERIVDRFGPPISRGMG